MTKTSKLKSNCNNGKPLTSSIELCYYWLIKEQLLNLHKIEYLMFFSIELVKGFSDLQLLFNFDVFVKSYNPSKFLKHRRLCERRKKKKWCSVRAPFLFLHTKKLTGDMWRTPCKGLVLYTLDQGLIHFS